MMTKDEARRHATAHANASAALTKLADVKSYLETVKEVGGVRLEWPEGSSLTGYKEMAREVSHLVLEQMPALMAEALRRVEAQAHAALHPARLNGVQTKVIAD